MGGRDWGGDDAGARGSRGNPASMLLRLRSQLELTDDQVKRLEALQDAPHPAANEADLLRARADLLEATKGDANLSKARAALDRMSALRNERMIAGLKQRQDARAVLTSTQKTRLDNLRGQLRERGGARGQRGPRMGRGGMQRGGMGPGQGPRMRGQFGPGNGPGMRGMRGGMAPAPRPPESELPPA
jgi:hypothetical protein